MFRPKKRAQATLELALAMVGVVILFFGCIKTFIWLNKVMVARQRLYDQSRPSAASVDPGPTAKEKQVNEDRLPRLNIL